MTDLRADLAADLLAGRSPVDDVVAAPAPSHEPLRGELADATPALCLRWTPLRWSRPQVVRAAQGTGKAVRVGPFTVELAVLDQ